MAGAGLRSEKRPRLRRSPPRHQGPPPSTPRWRSSRAAAARSVTTQPGPKLGLHGKSPAMRYRSFAFQLGAVPVGRERRAGVVAEVREPVRVQDAAAAAKAELRHHPADRLDERLDLVVGEEHGLAAHVLDAARLGRLHGDPPWRWRAAKMTHISHDTSSTPARGGVYALTRRAGPASRSDDGLKQEGTPCSWLTGIVQLGQVSQSLTVNRWRLQRSGGCTLCVH